MENALYVKVKVLLNKYGYWVRKVNAKKNEIEKERTYKMHNMNKPYNTDLITETQLLKWYEEHEGRK